MSLNDPSRLFLSKISKFKIFYIVVDFYFDLLGFIHQRYIEIFHVQTSIQCTQIYKIIKSRNQLR